ncbi:integrase arm-type DNA-binding domain-containing protein [Roseomonas frigidaquae]|uniref:Integrase arm-type DNA-binding domain-containing protein n=1 Tax=Falsiroseomonas frigidaquae TaxID=487318 RepID=A0ABX1EW19_9PROT|nr:integrase arm-type DNA-binding domain-containing protein [Falsiroseomonas frigidaquae]
MTGIAPPAARLRLTKRTVDAATCPPGRKDVLVFDAELKGFALRVTSAGSKVFIFQYRAGGAVRRVVLGDYGTLTPDQARDKAEVLRGQVRGGADPKAERAAARAAAAASVAEASRQAQAAEAAAQRQATADALTFKTLVERWRDLHLASRRSRYQHEASRALLASFAGWAERPAHGLTAAEAVAELDRIALDSGPAAARSAFAYGRAMFGWAMRRQLLPASPFAGIQPPAVVADRDRVLTDAELGAVWNAAGGRGWPMGSFVRLVILTLQRREEVAAMRWAELAPDLATWTVPAERAKNGKAHVVHLAPAARAILKAAPRLADSPLVFTTTGKTAISGFSTAKARLDRDIAAARKAAGLEPHELPGWRLHDLRRTGVTRLAGLGFAPHVCDRLLNHVQGSIQGVAAVYQRHAFLPERQAALEAWAKHVLAVASGKRAPRAAGGGGAKVVQLDPTRRRRA